jgi:tRNA (cytidine/uridine-2'-O-)-methyltransferase
MREAVRIALYQPDIAGNTGAILRLAACMAFGVDLIEPAGFDLSDRALKRAGMDYLERAALTRHVDWTAFEEWRAGEKRRLVLFTTKSALPYTDFSFTPGDALLFGRESAGVPDHVHQAADHRLLIPMPGGGRSLNVAMAAAMAAGEAVKPRDGFLRETFLLPRVEARAMAREWLDRWPKQAYWTEIESWREEPGDVIEFTMRRLPTAD